MVGMKRRRVRAAMLIQVLMMLLLITVLSAAVSSLIFVHLRWATHTDNQNRARNAAQSALNMAIARLAGDQEFAEDLVWQEGEERGILTFDATSGKPYSVNNTRSSVGVECWTGGANWGQGVVLPNSCHLVAVGTCRNARYVAEANVAFPPYPYALASSGPVISEGVLEVLGVDSFADAADGVSPSERREGHIVSNSSDASAVRLSSQAKVSGDVRAVGGVELGGATVEGQVKTGQQAADLPSLDIASYDPRRFDDSYNLELSPSDAESRGVLEASLLRVRVDTHGNTLNLNHGVKLDDGMLFVDGDVVIRGGVTGKGAIVATGKVTIYGASALEGDSTAVVSGGGVVLDGQGLGVSKFQGLVATEGDFEADSTSIVGAYLAAGRDPVTQIGTSKMKLRDVHAVQVPEANEMDLTVHVELRKVIPKGQFGSVLDDGYDIGVMKGAQFHSLTEEDSFQALRGTPGSTHPLTGGKVVLIDPTGNPVRVEELDVKHQIGLHESQRAWDTYLDSIASNTVTEVSIFNIDLNRFTSGSSRLKILTLR